MDETPYSGFPREKSNDPDQFLQRDRLLDVVLEPRTQDTRPVFGTAESTESSRRRRAAPLGWQGANLADEAVGALTRHRQVADQDIWAFALEGLERLFCRADSRHSRPAVFEHRGDPGAKRRVLD